MCLRGGLTPKHVDVPELLKHVKFEPTIPNIITGKPAEAANDWFIPHRRRILNSASIQIAKGQSVKLSLQFD